MYPLFESIIVKRIFELNFGENDWQRAKGKVGWNTANTQRLSTRGDYYNIKFGFLLCCLLMRFLIFSLVFWMLRIVFNVFSMMFAKMSLLFCCFCIRLFGTNNVGVVPYGVMRNLDAIIRVRMTLCETSMLLFA